MGAFVSLQLAILRSRYGSEEPSPKLRFDVMTYDAAVAAGKRPFCSVVIPAYQAADFVGQAIDSVLEQSYREREIIVVNDGSTDETSAIIRSYHGRVRGIDQVNGGPSVARNAGVAAARGDLIALLDADDWWAPNRLERCVDEMLEHTEVDVLTTDAFLVDDDTPTKRRWYGDFADFAFPPPEQQLASMLDCNFVFVSALMRRSLIEQVGGFDPAFLGTEDYDLWIRMLRTGANFGLIREPLAYYRVRDESLSRNAARQWTQHLHVLEKHLPGLWTSGVRARAGLYFQVAGTAITEARYRSAIAFLAMGVRAPGLSPATRARALARGLVDLARARVRRRN